MNLFSLIARDWNEPMEEMLSAKQAYLAMYSFLEELYSKYQFDQLGGLLGSMS